MNSSPLPETGTLAVGDVAALVRVMGTFILRTGRRDLVFSSTVSTLWASNHLKKERNPQVQPWGNFLY